MARYRIVPERSRVWIDARSSLHPIRSSTDGLEGFVELGSPPAGRLSLRVERLRSGNRLEDREMMKRVDARQFPTIEGVLTHMEPTERGSLPSHPPGRYHVRGDVSFRGVTREYENEIKVTFIDDRTVRLEGEAAFDVRDFEMEPPKILMLRVEPEVTVRVEIVAEIVAEMEE